MKSVPSVLGLPALSICYTFNKKSNSSTKTKSALVEEVKDSRNEDRAVACEWICSHVSPVSRLQAAEIGEIIDLLSLYKRLSRSLSSD